MSRCFCPAFFYAHFRSLRCFEQPEGFRCVQQNTAEMGGAQRGRGGRGAAQTFGVVANSRPGGTPAEISRGQERASGRSPRYVRRVGPCPSGASKKMTRNRAMQRPRHAIRGFVGCSFASDGRWAGRRVRSARGVSSMPRWDMGRSALQPGAASAGRTCPRLISCGVPPGRGTGRRSQICGRPRSRATTEVCPVFAHGWAHSCTVGRPDLD